MKQYINHFFEIIFGTAHWTFQSIIFNVPWYQNFFWGIIFISLLIWGLEITFPWRKEQKIFRKDFWLDAFYMFFNFFIFSIAISGFYEVISMFFEQIGIGIQSISLIDISQWSSVTSLLFFFIVLDFVQWFTHILIHKIPFLWRFHKVHHSVKQMGFAAHLRYHWMENILYKPLKVLVLMILGGFEPEQAYIVHFVAIAIGHFNHANIKITWGPFRYLFNSPVMHLYHHAHSIPNNTTGVNFGISLSLWDYLFGLNYMPKELDGKILLGYPGDETMPKGFWKQFKYGFSNNKQ